MTVQAVSEKSGRTHSRQQRSRRSKITGFTPLAAPPLGQDFVCSPEGLIYPPEAYRPGVDIYVLGAA